MDHLLLAVTSNPDTPVSNDAATDSRAPEDTHATTAEPGQEPAAATGLGAIGIDGRALLFQVINFVILLLILKKVAYKPILKLLDDRRRRIETGLQKADEAGRALASAEASKQELLAKARGEADQILAASQSEAAETVRTAETKAHTRAEQIVAEAHERTERESGAVRQQLRKELGGLVVAATEALIEEKLDTAKDSALIEKALRQAEGR